MFSQDAASSDSASMSSCSESLDLEDDGWEDVEPDVENSQVVDLFGHDVFDDVDAMLENCKISHDFDLPKVRKQLGVKALHKSSVSGARFLTIVYEVMHGNSKPDTSSKFIFDDPTFLKPVLQDDPLLYSFDDDQQDDGSVREGDEAEIHNSDLQPSLNHGEIVPLATQLHQTRQELDSLRMFVGRLDWDKEKKLSECDQTSLDIDAGEQAKDRDLDYFTSYSYNEIHETMLKDTIRTDAYRDFIYENKHIFEGKVVLDVGCGTGILSMFCARAGAKKVIAVDNSDIIHKASENIFKNGFGETIVCLRGKIEEIKIPAAKVDIIVSEWMGYCLLYEAMLDSVLWARDRYLNTQGLMVPSHTKLYIAPLTDPDYVTEHISYWRSVYGFDMTSMLANIYDDALVRNLEPAALAAAPAPFIEFALCDTTKEQLTFSGLPFMMELQTDIDALDGFVIWFDTFFCSSRNDLVPLRVQAGDWTQNREARKAFTTGPGAPDTHWHQGILLINRSKHHAQALKKGQIIQGQIGYQAPANNKRELEIRVVWEVTGTCEKGAQKWLMR